MDEKLYSIKEQTLIDIGDALRRKRPDDLMPGTVMCPAVIFNTPNTTGHDSYVPQNGTNTLGVFPIKIEGAATIKVIITFRDDPIDLERVDLYGGYYDNEDSLPPFYEGVRFQFGDVIRAEHTFSGDSVTFDVSIYASAKGGYYAEIIGYDEKGKPITTEDTVDIETEGMVPRTYTSAEMAAAIDGITTPKPVIEALKVTENGIYEVPEGVDGYGPVTVYVSTEGGLPEEAFIVTGDCQSRFANDGWNWFIDSYGGNITTVDINNAQYMFQFSKTLKHIPFDLNLNKNTNLNSVFMECNKLEEPPAIKGELNAPTSNYSGTVNMSRMFYGCNNIREIPQDYFNDFGGAAYWEASKNYEGDRSQIFYGCRSLRKLPDISMLQTNHRYSGSPQYTAFGYCLVLDEILNFPVGIDASNTKFTSNSFYASFDRCYRLKNLTFATQEDGTPYTRSYKSQVIDLTNYVGYANVYDRNTVTISYNSGITLDKEVTDDATYQALKDDPDWFTLNMAYARYNHDSAVATINSLPDTSAYLATAGGTNTIKFKGTAGSATDGGAINTLTEEEIAVATAKGWTVTLV